MIKQIKLFDSVSNWRALEEATRAKKAYDSEERPPKSSLAAQIADPTHRLEQLRLSNTLIAKAEAELNILIGEGYQIIAQYPIQSGVQFILYKPDTAPQPDEWPTCNQCGGWHDPAFNCGGHKAVTNRGDGPQLGRVIVDWKDFQWPDDYDPLVPGSGMKGL